MNKIFICLLILTCAACLEEPDCIGEASNEMAVEFQSLSDTITSIRVKINSVRLSGSDSLLYQGDSIRSVILPLNITSDTTTIIFDTEYDIDTMQVSYGGFTRLISPECGTERFFTDLNVVYHTFDSIRVFETIITPETQKNYEIFF